jgi:hypothetical protein
MSSETFGSRWWCRSSAALDVHSFVFFLLVTGFNPAWFGHYGFLEDEEACPPSVQGASSVCTIWLVQGEKTTELVQRWFAWHADTRCQVWGAWRVQNGEPSVYEPNAPPLGTNAKMGWPALGRLTALFIFFCLLWEWMLEPLLPREKTLATKT